MHNQLGRYIPSPVVAVVAYYPPSEEQTAMRPLAHVCGVRVQCDETLRVEMGCVHQMQAGQLVTLHLDNRTGVSDYDAELQVYRLSYKGRIREIEDQMLWVEPLEFQVFYGMQVEYEYSLPGYRFPLDQRQQARLPISPLQHIPADDKEEHENKVGVLVTCAQSQPHTTVMAFLSSENDDIFFITFPSTFKSQLLKRDNYCLFAIDNRATFTFEHAIQWNYTIISGYAHEVEKDRVLFEAIKEQFILKNPWEVGFFSHPEVEMYHITPEKVFTPA